MANFTSRPDEIHGEIFSYSSTNRNKHDVTVLASVNVAVHWKKYGSWRKMMINMRAMVKGKEKHAGERMTSIGSIYAMMDGVENFLFPFAYCYL